MDSVTIEKHAVNAVENSLLSTDILHPYLTSNDRGPSWDGAIYVYKNFRKENDNLDGTVPVQIKGVANNSHSHSQISYQAKTTDLNAYLRNGGVIYFVVRIHKDDPTNKRKIYYEDLTPVKLKNYLDGVGTQKTKAIKLREFPSDNYDKQNIVVNFLNHSRKQGSFVESGFISLDELKENASQYTYTIPFVKYGHNNTHSLFSALGTEMYLYATPNGSNVLIPADNPIYLQEIKTPPVEEKISIDGKCYYETYERIFSQEGLLIKIGNSLTLGFGKFEKLPSSVNFKVELSPYLRERVKDIRFIIDAVLARRFNVGDIELGINPDQEVSPEYIPSLQNRLNYYDKIVNMLDILNVGEDLNLDNLSKKETTDIEALVKAFVDKEDIPNIKIQNRPSLLDLKISDLTIRLILHKNDNGTHTISDFFDSPVSVSYKNEDGSRLIVSPYSALFKDDYLKISNINYERVLSSYQEHLDVNSKIFSVANNDLLKMLMACDEKPNTRLLKVAKDIAYWILTNERNDNIDTNIAILNYLQIIKRERPLDKNEMAQLGKITESENASEQEKTGAYLLLDSQTLAEIHWERLSDDEKIAFKGFPIYKFWSSSIE